jgi:hypothetical protein
VPNFGPFVSKFDVTRDKDGGYYSNSVKVVLPYLELFRKAVV